MISCTLSTVSYLIKKKPLMFPKVCKQLVAFGADIKNGNKLQSIYQIKAQKAAIFT